MGITTTLRSSNYAVFLLCMTVYGFCRTFMDCGILTYVPLALAAYYLYTLFASKKIEGGDKYNVIIIGAGMSGLNAAKQLKEIGVPFVLLEKASQLGGTWWYNKYPGAACDVASHLYSLSYYLNPWWSLAYSKQGEIEDYLFDFAEKFDLLPHISFNRRVTNCVWSDASQKWTVTTEDGVSREANFVISGIGALHVPLKPNFKNQETFKGRIVHSAEWTDDIDLRGKRVAVIGTGASAVQVVPNIAKDVKELVVFQRTPCWVPPREDFVFPNWLKTVFAIFPPLMLIHRWYIFWRGELRFQAVFHKDRKFLSNYVTDLITAGMKKMLNNPELEKKLIPNYPVGCKRITPSDTYLKAFTLPHVHLVTDPIDEFTANGIRSKEAGKEFEFDIVILATGFSVMDSSTAFSATGRSGKVLKQEWKDEPRLYLGTVHPGFPNLFFLLGPGTGLGHNSVIYVIECQTNYVIDAITKMIAAGNRSMDCKKERFDWYQDMMASLMKNRVFRGGGGCTAWYLNARGVNWTLWPGDLTHFWWLTRECKTEDYLIK